MAFAVVKFKTTDEVAVIPIHWINDDRCFWPPKNLETKIVPLIKKNITASQAWDVHPIKTLGVFATYKEARVKLSVAEEKSDLNTTDPEDQGRGKRQKKRLRRCSSSDESEDTVFPQKGLRDPPVFPPTLVGALMARPNIVNLSQRIDSQENDSFIFNTIKEINNENNISGSQGNDSFTLSTLQEINNENSEPLMNLHTGANIITPSRKSDSTNLSAFQKTLLRELHIIKANQRHIIETMGCILRTVGRVGHTNVDDQTNELIEKIINILPMSNLSDLEKLEDVLGDENACTQMVNYLQKVGGSHYEKATKYMLKKVMTDDVASSFSFLGIRGKRPFKPMKICKLIISAVRTHPLWKDTSDCDLERVISNWLRHASTRSKKKI